jgi:membrane associated rhomboid family serine protease
MKKIKEYFQEVSISSILALLLATVFVVQQFFFIIFYYYFSFEPSLVIEKLFIWQFFTYPFVYGEIADEWDILWLFIDIYVIWLFGREIEFSVGKKKYVIFLLLTVLGGSITAFILYFIEPNITNLAVHLPLKRGSLFFPIFITFASLYPDVGILLFFILPIKVKYLSALVIAFLIVELIVKLLYNPLIGIFFFIHLIGIFSGFIYLYITTNKQKMKLIQKRKSALLPIKKNKKKEEEKTKASDFLFPFLKDILYKAEKGENFSLKEIEIINKIKNQISKEKANLCNPIDFSIEDETCKRCEWLLHCVIRELKIKRRL